MMGCGVACTLVGFVLMWVLGGDVSSMCVTAGFFGGLGVLFGYDLHNRTYSKSWYPTIGMMGTFVGIVIGLFLLDLSDTNNMVNNLGALLNGLKLAFVTSIFGLLLSGIRKLLDSAGIYAIVVADPVEVSLKQIDKNTKQFNDDTTVVGQLELLRGDLKTFMGKMSNIAGDQLASAFNTVAADLNARLAEQFGENFKQFANAVDNLVAWQEQNREYMAEYMSQLRAFSDDYNSKLKMLVDAAGGLNDIVTRTGQEIDRLSTGLTAIADLADRAGKFEPAMKNMLESVNGVSDVMTNLASGANATIRGLNRNLAEAGKHVAGALGKFGDVVFEAYNKIDDLREQILDADDDE